MAGSEDEKVAAGSEVLEAGTTESDETGELRGGAGATRDEPMTAGISKNSNERGKHGSTRTNLRY